MPVRRWVTPLAQLPCHLAGYGDEVKVGIHKEIVLPWRQDLHPNVLDVRGHSQGPVPDVLPDLEHAISDLRLAAKAHPVHGKAFAQQFGARKGPFCRRPGCGLSRLPHPVLQKSHRLVRVLRCQVVLPHNAGLDAGGGLVDVQQTVQVVPGADQLPLLSEKAHANGRNAAPAELLDHIDKVDVVVAEPVHGHNGTVCLHHGGQLGRPLCGEDLVVAELRDAVDQDAGKSDICLPAKFRRVRAVIVVERCHLHARSKSHASPSCRITAVMLRCFQEYPTIFLCRIAEQSFQKKQLRGFRPELLCTGPAFS